MHPLLREQLSKLGLQSEAAPDEEQWRVFLDRISLAYRRNDNESYLQPQTGTALGTASAGSASNDPAWRASPSAANAPAAESSSNSATSKAAHSNNLELSNTGAAQMLAACPDTALLFNADLELLASSNIIKLIEPKLRERLTECGTDELLAALGMDVFAQIKLAVKEAMANQRAKRMLFELFHSHATPSFEARLLPFQQGGSAAVAVFIRNWTTVARASRAANMYKDLFDAASEGMMLLDARQRVVLVNRAFERMCDSSSEQLRALDSPSFLSAAGKSLDTEIWSHVFYHDTWSGEALFSHASGLSVPVWLTVDALKDQDGQNTHFLVLSSDVSQLKDTQDKLAHFASHDQLTGLPNRAFFQEHLSRAIARSQRSGVAGALFFMDLDNFKSVNDSLGHPVGDALLLEMAGRLQRFVREGELVSRIGGDEFTLVVENLGEAKDAAIVAQRVLKEFERPFVCEGHELDMSCSIGISVFPQDGDSRDKIIRQADTAMYSAKQAGRSTFKFYTSQLTHKAVQSFNVETQLRRAIERDELFLNFQPQMDMKRGVLTGTEVLLRWHNEQHGLISPAEFIPVAEASGLIEDIGNWVLDRACQQMSHWQQQGELPYLVSVNASRKQLVRPDFVKRVADTISRYSIEGGKLEIEVTESAIASSEKMAVHSLHGLRELGCKIAIDDFGTGYSSLSSLKTFPLDRLKIDRSFVQDLGQDQNADAIIAAIIALAKTLGLGVIAEGVETEQQVKALLKKGCRQAQGYFYSKPLLASDFREFVSQARLA